MLGSPPADTPSDRPVWYMARLALVNTLLRHGDDMKPLRDTTPMVISNDIEREKNQNIESQKQ